MEYYLMNKDTKLMKFSIDGEGVMEQCSVIEQYTNLPIWFPDITYLFRLHVILVIGCIMYQGRL